MPILDLGTEGIKLIPNYELRWIKDGVREKYKEIMRKNNTNNPDTVEFDVEKMSKFITFYTSIRVRDKEKQSEDYYINVPMVNCKAEWFENLGFADLELRLCPDFDYILKLPKKFWSLEGKYDSKVRTSFSTLVEVCQQNNTAASG